MRTLRIERGGRIIIDESPVDINQMENKSEFLASILTLDVELSEDISVTDIIHFFYDAKDLIKSVLSEEYEVVRAVVTSTNLPRNYKHVRVYKSFKIENEILDDNQEFIYLIPEIEMVPCEPGEDGVRGVGGLPIVIDESISLVHDNLETGNKVTIKSKTKISLLDLMTCVFDELPALIKEGLILSH
jgi:hypothetical protein